MGGMSERTDVTIEVHEPKDGGAGSVSAGKPGSEACLAVGKEGATWYLIVNEPAASAAGIEHQRLHLPCHREDAEYLVRLIGGLYATGSAAVVGEETQ